MLFGIPIIPSVRFFKQSQVFAGGKTTPTNVGFSHRFNPEKVFTKAQDDTRIFGLHTGIQMPGKNIVSPQPRYLGAPDPSLLTLRGNPWFMAPGWRQERRFIDIRYKLAGHHQPRLFLNPYDARYGTVGSYGTRNLEVIQAYQQGLYSNI